MHLDDPWSNCPVINCVTNALIDQKIENYEKHLLNFLKDLERAKSKWISLEAIKEKLMTLLKR